MEGGKEEGRKLYSPSDLAYTGFTVSQLIVCILLISQ